MDFAMLQMELLALLATMEGPFVGYAQTYAANIVRNVGVGAQYGDSPEKATRTQLLYVFNNLQGCSPESILKVDALVKRYGFDLPDAVRYALGMDEEDEASDN